MARYFFNVRDGVTMPDVDGTHCPSIDHARREAVRLAGYLLMTQPRTFWNGHEWFLETMDEAGHLLFRVKFQAENVSSSDESPSLAAPSDRSSQAFEPARRWRDPT